MSTTATTPRVRLARALGGGLRGLAGFGLGGLVVYAAGWLPGRWAAPALVPGLALAGYVGGSVVAARARSRRWTIAGGVGFAMGFGLVSMGIVIAIAVLRAGQDPSLWAAIWGVMLAVGGFFGGLVLGRPFLSREAGVAALLGPALIGALCFGPLGYLAGGPAFAGLAQDPRLAHRLLALALAAGGTLFGLILGLIAPEPPPIEDGRVH